MINKNPLTGLNHMFIEIWNNGKKYYIEPQGTKDRYMMGLIWGETFKPGYNIDVTNRYGQILP